MHGRVREHFAVLDSRELIPRHERARELRVVSGQRLIRVVERIAREELRAWSGHRVEARLHESLIEHLRERKGVLCQPAAEILPIRVREFVEEWLDGRIDRDSSGRKNAEPRVLVGHGRDNRPAKVFPQSFVAREKENLVAPNRASDGAAKLIPREVRFRVHVEVVARIERVVPVVLERASTEHVGAGFRDRIDLAANVPAELRAVAVGLDAELAHGLHPERGPGSAAGRSIGEIVQQRAVEQVDVRPRVLPVHAHGEAVRDDRAVVPMWKHGDPRLQRNEVGEVAAVDGQSIDRTAIHQKAQFGASEIERRRFSLHGDLVSARRLHGDRNGGLLGHRQPEACARVRSESGQGSPEGCIHPRASRR